MDPGLDLVLFALTFAGLTLYLLAALLRPERF
jgi:K+-transporting ATPase KdpF subunit